MELEKIEEEEVRDTKNNQDQLKTTNCNQETVMY